MAARLVALVTLLAFLVSCGGRPIGVMTPTGERVQGTSAVNLLVATTRAPSDDKAILFGGERGTGLKVDAISVSIPPEANRKVGQVQWPKKLPADPLKSFTTVSVEPLKNDPDTQSWIKRNSLKNKRVLVFVHGFNNRYEESVYRFAQIVHDSGSNVLPVVFTWPSRASVFD